MSDTWCSLADAPKDGTKVDLLAKAWLAYTDAFAFRRFTDCYWSQGDPMCNRKPDWTHVEAGWRVVGWMPIPALPETIQVRDGAMVKA